MNNTVYYIKPTNYDFSEAIKDGLLKAFSIMKSKGYTNIKLVIPNLRLIDNTPNYISDAFDKLFKEHGVSLTKQLHRDRGFSIPDFPIEGQTTGINLLLTNNSSLSSDNNTVVVLIWADYDSFKKVQSQLFLTSIDLVSVVFNETDPLNELISASKGKNFSKVTDPNVIPYTNSFPQNINDVLSRLKTINITDVASHNPTRDQMKSVINELTKKQLSVAYIDFLGFLVNDVNFKLNESVELINWKHGYFGR